MHCNHIDFVVGSWKVKDRLVFVPTCRSVGLVREKFRAFCFIGVRLVAEILILAKLKFEDIICS